MSHLALFRHKEYEALALAPQRREVIMPAHRGTICDRFGTPLALNRQEYGIAILYDAIRQVPRVAWEREGKKVIKRFKRREYVEELATLLGRELKLDPLDVEDAIYAHAALFPSKPHLIKENISESLYYKLKNLEREFPGIHTLRMPKRYYPNGALACDVIGYMGAINRPRLHAITHERACLKTFLKEREEGKNPPLPKEFSSVREICRRLEKLDERAYSQSSFIGRGGVEGRFEEALRGRCGHADFEVDREGRFIRKLPGERVAESGEKITLALSAELQDYAEKLLAYSEAVREKRFVSAGQNHSKVPAPWIKGGAILAMVPDTGEIVALASYPRFDPNDFIQKDTNAIYQWLESPAFIAQVWNGARPLTREFYSLKKKGYYTEEQPLTWEFYLDRVLATESPLKKQILSLASLEELFALQESEEIPLLSLIAEGQTLSVNLKEILSPLSPSDYRSLCQAKACLQVEAKNIARQNFHLQEFRDWRKEKFKSHLKKKRLDEEENKRIERPFTDYLHAKERKLFAKFWETNRTRLFLEFLEKNETERAQQLLSHLKSLPNELLEEALQAMRSYDELSSDLQKMARHFAKQPFGYLSSYAIHQATPQGSIFKIVTAYEAMRQQLERKRELNPLTLIDDYRPYQKTKRGPVLGFTTGGEKIPRRYRGGTLPRSRLDVGRVDMQTAIERSSNLYFSLLAGDVLQHPTDLIEAAKEFGFGARSGIDLPGEDRGSLPSDIRDNRTGLYSLAIGQHSLAVTPLQTARMMASIANGGSLIKPQIVHKHSGNRTQGSPFTATTYAHKQELQDIGLNFPLFTQTIEAKKVPYTEKIDQKVEKELFMPQALRKSLLTGMAQVVQGEKGSARPSRIRTLYEHQPFLRNYLALRHQMAGKTSTAEFIYRPTIDGTDPIKCKDVWFGAISYDPDLDHPELIVVVYLRFGDYGKEAAPYAAEIVQKWRQLNLQSL